MNGSSYPGHHALLTVERTAALDLSTHLLTHLNTSIVVCGPKGIGKTTLLAALQAQLADSWQYCPLAAGPAFGLETLMAAMEPFSHNAKMPLLLVLDDAGALPPGVIGTVLGHIASTPWVRAVFALTPDELYLKNNSDNLISECSVIEIPPLTAKQCGDFLQHLAAQPGHPIASSHFSDHAILALYQDSHGVPGNIIAALTGFKRRPKSDRTWALLIAAVILLVSLALGMQWLSQNNRLFAIPTPSSNQTPP